MSHTSSCVPPCRVTPAGGSEAGGSATGLPSAAPSPSVGELVLAVAASVRLPDRPLSTEAAGVAGEDMSAVPSRCDGTPSTSFMSPVAALMPSLMLLGLKVCLLPVHSPVSLSRLRPGGFPSRDRAAWGAALLAAWPLMAHAPLVPPSRSCSSVTASCHIHRRP